MIRDFWLTGVGVGGYQRAMSVYQPPHSFSFNHAHSEYLQIVSEGGAALAIPVAAALLAGAREIARQLRGDPTPVYWMRAGAASSLVAIGVQSIWETGIIMPANGVLFALCAAVAIHGRKEHAAGPEHAARPEHGGGGMSRDGASAQLALLVPLTAGTLLSSALGTTSAAHVEDTAPGVFRSKAKGQLAPAFPYRPSCQFPLSPCWAGPS
jgi:hypothetical protein